MQEAYRSAVLYGHQYPDIYNIDITKENSMEAEKKGLELIKKVVSVVVRDIKLGKTIAKDGIDASDVVHIPALIESVKDIIELLGQKDDIVAEAKDIDASEVGILLMTAWSAIQEVSKKEE